MLSQMQHLSFTAEGRYASDEELRFIPEYLKTYELRLQTYQKLQEVEQVVIQQVQEKMLAQDPKILYNGNVDQAARCKRDTAYTWRYCAAALLLNDTETLRDRFLLWFQTIMRAFNKQKSCYVAYTIMPEVVKVYLTPQQSSLFLPILDLNLRLLGSVQ